MRVIATGHLAQRLPRLDGDLAVGLGREIENDFGGIDITFDAWTAIGRTAIIAGEVELRKASHLVFGIPVDALAAVTKLVGQRSKRREATVGVGVIAFDNRDLRRVNTRKQIALALLPVPYVGLRKFARRVVLDRREHHIALDAEVADRELGKTTRDGLVNLPVAARFPDRVDGGGQRMNEGMHIRRVEIVLLVP